MMVPGVLVTCRCVPDCCKLALPCTTCAPIGNVGGVVWAGACWPEITSSTVTAMQAAARMRRFNRLALTYNLAAMLGVGMGWGIMIKTLCCRRFKTEHPPSRKKRCRHAWVRLSWWSRQ